MEKVRVCFYPENRCIEVDKGENLLRAAMKADVHINASCGGEGYCGKCRVIIEKGEVKQKLQVKLSDEEMKQGYVLACCSTHRDRPGRPRTYRDASSGDKKVLERRPPIPLKGYTLSAKDWAERLPQWELNPPTTKFHLILDQPTLEDNLSDAERIKREPFQAGRHARTWSSTTRCLQALPSTHPRVELRRDGDGARQGPGTARGAHREG